MTTPAIQVRGLGKRFRIGARQEPYKRLTETVTDLALAPLRRLRRLGQPVPPDEEIWALKDVSFDVLPGEVVGVIGRNGAGKSTLLKILSRITEPTEGEARIHGRVGSLLEVGTGFHPELTGRENIFLNGAILGMKRDEIRRKFDEMVAFAEIDRFIDTPVKRYSSGMYVRLAFAVAAHLETEILLVDEVLAVGDAVFQKKCLGKMGEVARGGRTVLFVSHNLAAISQFCRQSIWIEQGFLRLLDASSSVIDSYLRNTTPSALPSGQRTIDLQKEFQLLEAHTCDEAGAPTDQFDCDHPVVISMLCEARRSVAGLYGYLSVQNIEGAAIMVSDSFDTLPNCLDQLLPGRHLLTVTIPPRTLGHGVYDVYVNFTSAMNTRSFQVDGPGIVCRFTLGDSTSTRGNRRTGYFSTLPRWQSRAVPATDPASAGAARSGDA